MKAKNSVFCLELEKFDTRWNLTVLLLFYVLLLGMIQVEMNEYKGELIEIEKASMLEKEKASQFNRYTPYGVHGIRLISLPAPLNFLSASQVYGSLVAAVDTGTKLIIYESRKGNKVIPDTLAGYLNFPWILLLIGSLLCLIYGFTGFSNGKYLKFLCGLKTYRNVFLAILLARIAVVSLFIILLAAGTLILAVINGIDIIDPHYFYHLFLVFLVMNFSVFTGAAAGSVKNKKKGIALLAAIFLILNGLVPWLIVKTVQNISVSISEHQTEYDKLKILMAFEKRGFEKFGDLRTGEKVKEFIKSYFENEIKILENMEKEHKARIIEKIGKYRMLSVVFPSSFYLMSNVEISGRGANNYLCFYDFAGVKKRKFIEFYAEKKFFSDPKPDRVESFLKGDDNIFYSRGSLPANFLFGLGLMVFYTVGLGLAAYRNGRKKVYPVKEKLEGEESLYILLKRGESAVLFTTASLVKAKVYNYFSGKEKVRGEIDLVEEKKEGPDKEKRDFVYLVEPACFHGIKPHSLHGFLFGKPMEENMETWEILFKYARERELVIMDGFLEALSPDKVDTVKLEVKERKLFCLIISSDYYFTLFVAGSADSVCCLPNEPAAAVLKKELEKRSKESRDPLSPGTAGEHGLFDHLLADKPEDEVEN
jgi:hypothetical protein